MLRAARPAQPAAAALLLRMLWLNQRFSSAASRSQCTGRPLTYSSCWSSDAPGKPGAGSVQQPCTWYVHAF
jgi:hypothetical protein